MKVLEMSVRQFKNQYSGETCIVAGNGPSLNAVPDAFLGAYAVFGTNRVYLRFVPDFYVAVNPLVITQNRKDIEGLSCNKFLPEWAGFWDAHGLHCVGRREFSYEPDKWVYEGYTVTFVCLQLAYYFGFDTVLLVGVDHRYEYEGAPNEQKIMQREDPNHFDPRYFKGQVWNNPDLEKSEQAYWMAEQAYTTHGRKILNLTPNSALQVFDTGRMEEWA